MLGTNKMNVTAHYRLMEYKARSYLLFSFICERQSMREYKYKEEN